MYQSIPSLTIPQGDPGGFAHSRYPGGRFLPKYLCPGGRGFELEKFSTALKEKMQELLDLFQRNQRQLAKAGAVAMLYINFCENSRCLLYLY